DHAAFAGRGARLVALRLLGIVTFEQFLFARALADCDIDRAALPVAIDFERHTRARLDIGDEVGKRLFLRHIPAIDLRHDIARTQPGLVCSFAGFDRLDELAALVGQAERPCNIVIPRADPYAEIAA